MVLFSFLKKHLKSTIFNTVSKLPAAMQGPAHILVTRRFGLSRKFRNRNVGKCSYIDPSVMIFGWKNVIIGNYTTVGENVWINANFREDPQKKIIIGNNCHIAKNTYFSCGPLIRLKDYSFIGFNCNFLGCGHQFNSPLIPYIASGLYPGDIIEIGVNCWLTGNVTVLEGVKIGCGSVLGAGTMVTHDIPPFSLAIGNPCRVIRRFDFKNNEWIAISNWNEDHEKCVPSEDEYLRELRKSYNIIPPSLITSSRRFGWL